MPRRKQPGHYHHGSLDRALIEAAVELTAEGGVEAWSLSEAARRVGVSTAAPYKHFKNKSELLDAVAVHGLDAVRRAIERGLAESEDAREQLVAVMRGMVRLARRRPALYGLTFSGVRKDTIAQLEKASPESAFGVLRAAVAAWRAAGLLRHGDDVSAAIVLWAHAHGLASLVASGRITVSEKRAMALAEDHAASLLDGL